MSQLKFKVKGAKTVFWYARCDSEKATKDNSFTLKGDLALAVIALIKGVG